LIRGNAHNVASRRAGRRFHNSQEIKFMETAQLIQAAASIASAMAATQYGKFGGMEASRIQDIAAISVKIAKAIEVEALKP
jgi:uncharacterized cupredoxin-like copper-binding protein